jgi:hypothetical protein
MEQKPKNRLRSIYVLLLIFLRGKIGDKKRGRERRRENEAKYNIILRRFSNLLPSFQGRLPISLHQNGGRAGTTRPYGRFSRWNGLIHRGLVWPSFAFITSKFSRQ